MITPPFIRDWQIGARGGDDFWVRAEQFIAKRISGEVDRKFLDHSFTTYIYGDIPQAESSCIGT
jgi:hypothetical protein